MPSKQSPPKPKPETPARSPQSYRCDAEAKWGGFVNVKLDDMQKFDFSQWYEENVNQSGLLLDELLGAGMKVSISFDKENSTYLVSLTGRLISFSDERFCVTTRAGTLSETLALATWKHFYVVKDWYDQFLYPKPDKPLWG